MDQIILYRVNKDSELEVKVFKNKLAYESFMNERNSERYVDLNHDNTQWNTVRNCSIEMYEKTIIK